MRNMKQGNEILHESWDTHDARVLLAFCSRFDAFCYSKAAGTRRRTGSVGESTTASIAAKTPVVADPRALE